MPNAGYDLRVIAVGNKVFGYYRDVPQGEFRASGMGMVRKGILPEDAVHLAMQVIKKLDLVIAAVDMLRDSQVNYILKCHH
jgi:glutathione synthase/RimK-type ligase-like ATP-grasp enzyme